MKPKGLVDRLLSENHTEGANLTQQEIQQAYLNDYTGDMGLLASQYVGPSDSGSSHRYLALFQDEHNADGKFMVTSIYVSKKPDGKLTVDFEGNTDFDSDDRAEAQAYFDKEAHVRGGGDVKPAVPAPKPAAPAPRMAQSAPYQPNARQRAYRGGSGDSPHWDGNRYAI